MLRPADWLALGEQMRMDLIEQHHKAHAIKLPNAHLHAVTHLIVENQIAEGDALPAGRSYSGSWRKAWTATTRFMPSEGS